MKLRLFAIAIPLVLAACSHEEVEGAAPTDIPTLTAAVQGASSDAVEFSIAEMEDPEIIKTVSAALASAGGRTVNDRGCNNQVELWSSSDAQWVSYNLDNLSRKTATVTVERFWSYQGRSRSDKKTYKLRPGQKNVNVLYMQRIQRPSAKMKTCALK